MSIHENYNHTLRASYIGYISQAIVNNFAPLLFLTFQKTYGISLDKITLLVTMNFAVQLLVDFLAAGFVDRIGYRRAIVLAHLLCAGGVAGLGILPELTADPYLGFLGAVLLYAAGGGLKGRGHDKHRPGLTAETEAEGTPAIGAEALHGFKGGGEIGGVQLLRAAHGLLPEAVPTVAAVTDAIGDLVLHEDIVVVRIGDDLQFRGGALLKDERAQRAGDIQHEPRRPVGDRSVHGGGTQPVGDGFGVA